MAETVITKGQSAASIVWWNEGGKAATENLHDPKTNALILFVANLKIIAWLAENDTQALKQAQEAINGKSYEDYL